MILQAKMNSLTENNKSFVLATIVKTTGSTPGKTGFKMIIEPGGITTGTVGGGAIEMEAINEAKMLLETDGESILKEYFLGPDENLMNSEIKTVPMSCIGKVWIFYEVTKCSADLYIFGGGHVGQAVIDLFSKLDFDITLIDNRKEIIEKLSGAQIKCICSDYIEYAGKFNPLPNSYYVILTHGHEFDYAILKTLYKRMLVKKYAGVIASKNKAAEIIKNLKNELGKEIDLSLLHTPIGLKIGGNSPYEIALAIASEIQGVKYGKIPAF